MVEFLNLATFVKNQKKLILKVEKTRIFHGTHIKLLNKLSNIFKKLKYLKTLKYSNKIFILYNRRFYQTTNYLKNFFIRKKNGFRK